MFYYTGYFKDLDGTLSSSKRIQDNKYYQNHSYELRCSVSINEYKELFKKLVHPVGTNMFGSFLLKKKMSNVIDSDFRKRIFQTTLMGNYTPYTFTTIENLRSNSVGTDLYPEGYNPTAATGPTGSVFTEGHQGITFVTVPEDGITAHDPLGKPLGTAGTDGFTSANARGMTHWYIHPHPNVVGATTGMNGISTGASMGSIYLRSFFDIPL